MGPRARVLAVGVQRRPGRRASCSSAPAGRRPTADGYPTGRRARRALPGAAGGDCREIAARAAARRTRDRRHARTGIDKLKDAGRDEAPFELVVEQDGVERRVPGARGDRRLRAPGRGPTRSAPAACRRSASARSPTGSPTASRTCSARDRARYAGKRVLVVGSGHSAFNAILDLVALRDSEPATEIVWAIRGGGARPQVRRRRRRPAAGARRARRAVRGLVEDGASSWSPASRRASVGRATAAACCADGERELVADEVIAATGFRPDLALLGELRLDLDDRVEAARALAPLIDPNLHSLRLGAAARRRRARPPRGRLLHGRHEELRPRADLPAADRLRAGPLGRRGARRRLGGRRAGRAVLPETGVCCTDPAPPTPPARDGGATAPSRRAVVPDLLRRAGFPGMHRARTAEHAELVIVGGGQSGLAAAYARRHRAGLTTGGARSAATSRSGPGRTTTTA